MKKTILKILLILIVISGGAGMWLVWDMHKEVQYQKSSFSPSTSPIAQYIVETPIPEEAPSPVPTPSPSPIPSPDPLVYGPCKNIPVLMYHHVQTKEEAMLKKQTGLTVNSDVFAAQMAYLSSRGYHTLTPDQFMSGLLGTLPAKPVLITFDDGYSDFYTYAYPELTKNNLKSTMFLPTGLVGNPDYLNWGQISEISGSSLVTFANHTWSHKNLGKASESDIKYEIETSQTQMEEHGLGRSNTFSYPYGTKMNYASSVLPQFGIKIAFTTVPGTYQCAKLPYDFRRIRVGNSSMSSYGL